MAPPGIELGLALSLIAKEAFESFSARHISSEGNQKHQIVDSHQINTSYYSPNSAAVSWSTQGENQGLRENGVLSNFCYNNDQQVDPTLRNTPDGTNVVSINSTSCSGATNVVQDYSGYTTYPNTDSYGYSNTGEAAHYNQYQQQSNDYQQPPIQYQQQSNQYQQQSNQYQHASEQYQQPSNHYQQLSNHYQQPSNHYQQPSNQYQQPSSQYQQPSSQYQLPSSQYQEPSSQYQQPSGQYQQPSGQYQQPSGQYQQPSGQYQQPSGQYQQPSGQYQQPSNQSYPHHLGAYQNTGAPHQPLSSFQNTGSYAGPASYSSTYYSPGDYQTSGSHTSGTYGTQTNLWQGGQYAAYSSHQYPNYTPDSNAAYSSTTAVAASQYQQHYKQWEDYYSQTQTEVSCAPGTEKISTPNASSVSSSVPNGSSGYAASNDQITAAYTTSTSSWRPASSVSEPISAQPVTVNGSIPEGYWKHGSSVLQNDLPNTVQPHIRKTPDVIPMYANFQNQQNSTFSQGSMEMYPASYQVSQSHQSSSQTVPQPPEHFDSRKASKLQIPTNPRIAILPLVSQKCDKESSMTSAVVKPAYISVGVPMPNAKVASHDEADSMLKPGTFPKSLRGYVERVLARCRDDRQKAASQEIMKEVITKATADGTLYTRDWDTEPLFPMPDINAVNKDHSELPIPTLEISKNRRSPGRRGKSRWEPIPHEKLIQKSANFTNDTAKYGGWNKQFAGGKSDNKGSLGTKSSLPDQKSSSKIFGRPAKRQCLGNDLNAADDGEASSDSDKAHTLTKYYAAAIALADSPEEKKRRDSRSKRFDKGHGIQIENSNLRAKDVGPGNSYARRASVLVLSRSFEESGTRAVEDIDWDALTVKGTCQEIEKRYLRLTSAPDPATVRPEEVLEKALLMVQNSQKNYLFKCDQLKSIRQDLTVQHIRNELTVKVYETHARLAIEVGDLSECNQIPYLV
ncbi:hypothetical protein RD792_013538 [Penstemon davidsonii]|uniref:SAC3/GANP/THP3 conserved domain-containing protein n=1 Tax=Penstemon davidsonii TaxID=160366 RepID=A0ABR0CTS7_9LAMI|nr:hypothetical protein RD792_013538 [Penstemon davidsonii]